MPNVCGLRLYVEENNSTAQAVYQRLGLSRSPYKVYELDFVLAGQDGLKNA
jgi:ribosomal protein S18 acetylase RimI-like enzyme